MNYFKIHPNKKSKARLRRKRKGFVSAQLQLAALTTAISACQTAAILSQPIPNYRYGHNHKFVDPKALERLNKATQIAELATNTFDAIANRIPKSEMKRRFKETGRYVK